VRARACVRERERERDKMEKKDKIMTN